MCAGAGRTLWRTMIDKAVSPDWVGIVASKSPARDGVCPYWAGIIHDARTGFVHEPGCAWVGLAIEMAERNVARLHDVSPDGDRSA